MVDIYGWRDRLNGLRLYQRDLQLNFVSCRFNERDIKDLLAIVNDYIAFIEQQKEDQLHHTR